MADPSAPTANASLPDRSKEAEPADGDKGPSKNALKKAQKEAEKAAKKAARQAEEAKQKAAAEADDVSKNDYGDLPLVGSADYSPPGDKRTTLEDIAKTYHETSTTVAEEPSGGVPVVFRAVVENAREQSAKLTFLVLGHRIYSIQAVVAASDKLSRQMVKFAKNITSQSQVLVHGLLKKPKDYVKSTSIGWLEVHVQRLFVIARAEPLAIQVEDCERPLPEEAVDGQEKVAAEDEGRPLVTLNTRLNNRTIDLRAKLNFSIFRIKDGVCALFSEFLRSKGFVGIQTPKMLGAATESGASVFSVKYFNTNAFLAQSPQLHKQMLIAAQFERVFEIGPIFRAENSNTARHLTEFTGLDLEMAYEESYHEVLDVLEELMLFIFRGLQERFAAETQLVQKTYKVEPFKLPEVGKTPRIHFAEGVKMLREAGVEIGDFDDISTAQEKHLGRLVLQKYNTDFYILDQYPLVVRPFYTMPSTTAPPASLGLPASSAPDPSDPAKQYSNSYDFHMRGQEILSGAQRVHDADLLVKRMKGMDPPIDPAAAGMKEYVEAFRGGCPPHAGAGLGLERIVMLWLGLPNIRLATAFPRDPGRLLP